MPGCFFLGLGTGEALNEHIFGDPHPARGRRTTERRAGRLIGTSPDPKLIKTFEKAGGKAKLRYGELTVCWARSEAEARRTAHGWWPTAAMPNAPSWELPLPSHSEAAAELVTEDAVAESITCGPDPGKHIEAIRKYARAGYDHVCSPGRSRPGRLHGILRSGSLAETSCTARRRLGRRCIKETDRHVDVVFPQHFVPRRVTAMTRQIRCLH
jgi:hypothetical protein